MHQFEPLTRMRPDGALPGYWRSGVPKHSSADASPGSLMGDAVCDISLNSRNVKSGRTLGGLVSRMAAWRQHQGSQHAMTIASMPAVATMAMPDHVARLPPDTFALTNLPDPAASAIFAALDAGCRRSLRLVSRGVAAWVDRSVRCLSLEPGELANIQINMLLERVVELFPGLSVLELRLPRHTGVDGTRPAAAAGAAEAAALAKALSAAAGRLSALHCLSVVGRLHGELLDAVSCFAAAAAPHLRKLLLPGQCAGRHRGRAVGGAPVAVAGEDTHALIALLEALPGLTHLDLGGHTASAAALTSGAVRQLGCLTDLVSLSASATGLPAAALVPLGALRRLRSLRLRAGRVGTCDSSLTDDPVMTTEPVAHKEEASALGWGWLCCLTELTLLELAHHDVSSAEMAPALSQLRALRVLSLDDCPSLDGSILLQVSRLAKLRRVTLPFSLNSRALGCLARLPALSELLTMRAVELGPSDPPYPASLAKHVTLLVAGRGLLTGSGGQLAEWLPGLRCVALGRACDGALDALHSSAAALSELRVADATQVSDDGFASLASLRGLAVLELGRACSLTDAGLSAVFGSTMPALTTVVLEGCSTGVSDAGLLHLTAACRRLVSITFDSCPGLGDKTLRRLAHLEHLRSVSVRCCSGMTTAGVSALATAPHIQSLLVAGCPGVESHELSAQRPGLRLRVLHMQQ